MPLLTPPPTLLAAHAAHDLNAASAWMRDALAALRAQPPVPAPELPASCPTGPATALRAVIDEQPAALGVAQCLRGYGLPWPEDLELDCAVRHWEAARRQGDDWSADFGACWRQIEFAATALLLAQLADLDPLGDPALPRMALVLRSATRYRELAPLLPWLEQRRPGVTQRGYA
jgi:hypothetical protein